MPTPCVSSNYTYRHAARGKKPVSPTSPRCRFFLPPPGTTLRRAACLERPSILEVLLSSLTVPFFVGAARGLAGDERLTGELDLLVVARRRAAASRAPRK